MFQPGSYAHTYMLLGELTKKIDDAQATITKARNVNPDRAFQTQLDIAQETLDAQRVAVERAYEKLAALAAEN